MSTNKNNKKPSPISQKLYNPKSHAPAVYIPCWLIQVPNDQLSLGAKVVYGRLSQWSNTKGDVYRSSNQLSIELGISQRSIQRHIKELCKVGLIGTFQNKNGGINHYEFYEHEWMHAKIHSNLSYQNPISEPCDKLTYPLRQIEHNPCDKLTDHKYKEIKRNKNIYLDHTTQTLEKSDFEKPKEKIPEKKLNNEFGLTEMKGDNPHDINEGMLVDWLEVRRKKKTPITRTAWNRINKNLSLVVMSTTISAMDAFETMVTSGWQSLELKYFDNQFSYKPKEKEHVWTVESVWNA